MSRKGSRGTTFHLARWRGRTSRLVIGMAVVLLVREARAAQAKTPPASAIQTNRVAVSATGGFDLELTRSVYKPHKARDPFLKPGTAAIGSDGLKTAMAGQLVFRLQAILWSPKNPSAVVNDQLLDLNKSVILSTASGDVEVKAVEIGRERVVLEVVGQRVELRLNPEEPSGKPPE
jgi:hypothetical protein